MPLPSNTAVEEFERQYEIEFKRYEEENKNDTILNTIRRYPLKNLILFTLAYRSLLAFRATCFQLNPLQLVLAIGLGYFLADFLTGLIHMACDNIPLSLNTIQSGRPPWEWAAYGFHYHHTNPTDWNHNNIYFGAIVRAGFLFYVPLSLFTLQFHSQPFFQMTLLVCSHTGVLSQYAHAASHGRFHGRRLVQLLQKYHIILNPSIHKLHHQYFDQNYAILNGWSNGIINWIYTHWVAPCAPESVRPDTQKQLYHDKLVWIKKNAPTTPSEHASTKEVFSVKSIQPHYVIFPEYRKHKGCPI